MIIFISPRAITNTLYMYLLNLWIAQKSLYSSEFCERVKKKMAEKCYYNTDLSIVFIYNIEWDRLVDYTNWQKCATFDDTCTSSDIFFCFDGNKIYSEKTAFIISTGWLFYIFFVISWFL